MTGERRAERLRQEAIMRAAWLAGLVRRPAPRRWKDATGIKRQYVPGSTFEGRNGTLTPYFRRELARRRAARRVAHESRRRNRCR